jgi:hypothetical protein
VIIPDTIPSEEPITVVRDVIDVFLPNYLLSTCDEDATDLRRGDDYPILPLALTYPRKQVVPFALALALDELPREITLN